MGVRYAEKLKFKRSVVRCRKSVDINLKSLSDRIYRIDRINIFISKLLMNYKCIIRYAEKTLRFSLRPSRLGGSIIFTDKPEGFFINILAGTDRD